MYIYFDKNGTIKEVINDESIRRGSNDYNKIYCYLEGNPDIDDIWYLQKNPDGTLTNEVSFVDNIVTKSIPYDSKRDMKYFQDFEEYKFYVFTLSSSYLSQNGLVVATIRVAENNTLWALGELTFNVQANIVNSDNDITQSQYDYLLLSYASRTLNEQTGSDLDNLLDDKIEAKMDGLGTPDIFDTTANIEALTSNGGIAVATDTGYIWIWNSESKKYVNTNYKYLADVSVYYTKDEINNYKKMFDNLVYSCEFTIDDSAKTMTISGNWAFTKYSFIVIDNIAVKTISYASLSLGNYCLVIRNNALEFVNFANATQDGDMVLWIGFIDSSGDIRTDIYRCNNKVTNLALYCSDNIKIDTTNKNFVIPSAFLFWNSGYASISAQNISYASYLNATCVLVYRNGVFKVLGLQNIELFYNDVIVAVVWFRSDGFPMSKIYVVNEAPDKAITELPLSSKIFMRVGVIGDSYTSGWIKDNDHKNNPNYSWVKHMKQLTGNEWTNFGVSGSSTKSWVDGTLGQLPQVQTKGNKCQAYVIGLMINDQNQGMQTYVPLGTSSDIGTNANSYYAYYYKLINALLSVNSSAIIFCNTCPRTDGDFPSYNQAVIDVVNYCQSESKNVYLIELRNYYWRNETFNNDALNGHYTAIGYEYMAEIFNKAFSDTINANAYSLKEVNLIPYDSVTVIEKEVIVSEGEGYGSTTYKHNSIQTSNPRKPTCEYSFPDEKSGTLALTSDIHNPTITFTQGGTTKGSISLNQSTDQTIALDAGGSGGGSSVVANPTLSGDEATLNGLEVDGTKYKVGGSGGSGGKLYLHNVILTLSNKKFTTLFSLSTPNPIGIDYLKNLADLNIKITFISLNKNDVATSTADGVGCVKKLDEITYYFGWYNFPSGNGNANLEDGIISDTLTEV